MPQTLYEEEPKAKVLRTQLLSICLITPAETNPDTETLAFKNNHPTTQKHGDGRNHA
jgi:hypothetical protein